MQKQLDQILTNNSLKEDAAQIINQTQGTIDSINIKSFDHHSTPNYLKLEPGESQIYWLDMNDLPKVDGDWLIRF